MNSARFRPRWALLVVAGAGWVLLWGLPTLAVPLANDQLMFALGARTILDGGQLYVDLWDIKPPLIYLLYALPLAVAGEHFEAIRVLDLANTFVAMGAIFLLGRRFFSTRAAIVGAAFYGFAYLTWAELDGLAAAESFMAGPLLLAFAVYRPDDSERRAGPRAAAAGALLALVALLKLSSLLFVLGLPAAELLLRRRGAWSLRGATTRLAVAGAGFALVVGAFAAYLAIGGALDDYVEIQRRYTAPYSNLRWSPPGESYERFVVASTGGWLRIRRSSSGPRSWRRSSPPATPHARGPSTCWGYSRSSPSWPSGGRARCSTTTGSSCSQRSPRWPAIPSTAPSSWLASSGPDMRSQPAPSCLRSSARSPSSRC